MGGDVVTLPHMAPSSSAASYASPSPRHVAQSPTYLSDFDSDSDGDSDSVLLSSSNVHKTPSKQAVPSVLSSGGSAVSSSAPPKEYLLFSGKRAGLPSSIPVETIDDESSDDSDVEEVSYVRTSVPPARTFLSSSQPIRSARAVEPTIIAASQPSASQVLPVGELYAEAYGEHELEQVVDDLDMLYEAEATAAEAELEVAADEEDGMEEELSEMYGTASAGAALTTVVRNAHQMAADSDSDMSEPISPPLSRKRSTDSADETAVKRPRVTIASDSDDELIETRMYVNTTASRATQPPQPVVQDDESPSDDEDYPHLFASPRLTAPASAPAVVARTSLTEALMASSSEGEQDDYGSDSERGNERKAEHEPADSHDASSVSDGSRDASPEPTSTDRSSASELEDHHVSSSSSESDSDNGSASDSGSSDGSEEQPTATTNSTSAIRQWWDNQARRRDALAEHFSSELDVEYEREVLRPQHAEYQQWLAEHGEEETELQERAEAFRAANYSHSESEVEAEELGSGSESGSDSEASSSDSSQGSEPDTEPDLDEVAGLQQDLAQDATQLRDYLVQQLQQQGAPASQAQSLVAAPVQQPRGVLVTAVQTGLSACKAVGGLVGAWYIGNVIHQTLRQMNYISQ